MPLPISNFTAQIHTPSPTSHKGDNGKAMIIGGSDLFHAASQWAFQVASCLVDMAFYSSTSENNEIIQQSKIAIRDGVVIPREQLPEYITQVQAVLLGPGMRRDHLSRFSPDQLSSLTMPDLQPQDWEHDTAAITSALLHAFRNNVPQWVLDAGALQVLHPDWLPPEAILTPHRQELAGLLNKTSNKANNKTSNKASNKDRFPQPDTILTQIDHTNQTLIEEFFQGQNSISPQIISESELPHFFPAQELKHFAQAINQANILIKGPADFLITAESATAIIGGNAGLTKGGTGDALAGLITGLTANSPVQPAIVAASYLIKQTGHQLWQERGFMFNTSDVVARLPQVFRSLTSF